MVPVLSFIWMGAVSHIIICGNPILFSIKREVIILLCVVF